MPIDVAAHIAKEVCMGLDYAHRKRDVEGRSLNIVHRDISPPNILISKMGEVKVVDFGLAKANSQIESTDPGVVKGKFSYLSPEAASGLDVDHRADIFALGILLWEMLTGRRLFYGETDYQTVELVRQARVPSIAALNPEIEPELEQIARKALARDPEQRYQSAADMSDALAHYLFSRRMKVTARDIATLVREVQVEHARKRSLAPKESIIDALIQDEMGKLTSLIEEESPAMPKEGATILDPNSFADGIDTVDTSSWASEVGFDSAVFEPPAAREVAPRPPAPRPPAPRLPSPAPEVARAAPPPAAEPSPGEIESLQQMLEPDKTGLHARPRRDRRIFFALMSIVLLTAAIGAGLFLYREQILDSLGGVLPGEEPATGGSGEHAF
jgi:serine/threonine-protein kinase